MRWIWIVFVATITHVDAQQLMVIPTSAPQSVTASPAPSPAPYPSLTYTAQTTYWSSGYSMAVGSQITTSTQGQMCVSATGLYMAHAGFRWAAPTTGERINSIRVDGTNTMFGAASTSPSFSTTLFNPLALSASQCVTTASSVTNQPSPTPQNLDSTIQGNFGLANIGSLFSGYVHVKGASGTQSIPNNALAELGSSFWTGSTTTTGGTGVSFSNGRFSFTGSSNLICFFDIPWPAGTSTQYDILNFKNNADCGSPCRFGETFYNSVTRMAAPGFAALSVTNTDFVSLNAYQTTGSSVTLSATAAVYFCGIPAPTTDYRQVRQTPTATPVPWPSQSPSPTTGTDLSGDWIGGPTISSSVPSPVVTQSPTGRLVAGSDGYYLVCLNYISSASGAFVVETWLGVSGSITASNRWAYTNLQEDQYYFSAGCEIARFTASQQMAVYGMQNSGSTRNNLSPANYVFMMLIASGVSSSPSKSPSRAPSRSPSKSPSRAPIQNTIAFWIQNPPSSSPISIATSPTTPQSALSFYAGSPYYHYGDMTYSPTSGICLGTDAVVLNWFSYSIPAPTPLLDMANIVTPSPSPLANSPKASQVRAPGQQTGARATHMGVTRASETQCFQPYVTPQPTSVPLNLVDNPQFGLWSVNPSTFSDWFIVYQGSTQTLTLGTPAEATLWSSGRVVAKPGTTITQSPSSRLTTSPTGAGSYLVVSNIDWPTVVTSDIESWIIQSTDTSRRLCSYGGNGLTQLAGTVSCIVNLGNAESVYVTIYLNNPTATPTPFPSGNSYFALLRFATPSIQFKSSAAVFGIPPITNTAVTSTYWSFTPSPSPIAPTYFATNPTPTPTPSTPPSGSIRVLVTGYYMVNFNMRYNDATQASQIFFRIQINGVSTYRLNWQGCNGYTTQLVWGTGAEILYLTANDYVTVIAYQNAGSTINLLLLNYPQFAIAFMGADGTFSMAPSKSPSRTPSKSPSKSPSRSPSRAPSRNPSRSPSGAPTGLASSSYYTQWFSNQSVAVSALLQTGFTQPFTDQYSGTKIYKSAQGVLNTTEEGLFLFVATNHWVLGASSDYYVDLYAGNTNYASVGASATTQRTFESLQFIRYFSTPIGANLVGRTTSATLGDSVSTQFSAYKFRDFEPDFVYLCGGTDQGVTNSGTELTTYFTGCTGQTIGGALSASNGRISCTYSPCPMLVWYNPVVTFGSFNTRLLLDSGGVAKIVTSTFTPTFSPTPVSASAIGIVTLTGSSYASLIMLPAVASATLVANPKFTFGAVRITDPYLQVAGNGASPQNAIMTWSPTTSSASLGSVFAYTDSSRIVTLRACTIYVFACTFGGGVTAQLWLQRNLGLDPRRYGYFSLGPAIQQPCLSAVIPMQAGDNVTLYVQNGPVNNVVDSTYGALWLSDSVSVAPSKSPSRAPSKSPSRSPSKSPTTTKPSKSPSRTPSRSPSRNPSSSPSKSPTISIPTRSPSRTPTKSPSLSPSRTPSFSPTKSPSKSPSASPSITPTFSPTAVLPTRSPSFSPTGTPSTQNPSKAPTMKPSLSPTNSPTVPTNSPSLSPTARVRCNRYIPGGGFGLYGAP